MHGENYAKKSIPSFSRYAPRVYRSSCFDVVDHSVCGHSYWTAYDRHRCHDNICHAGATSRYATPSRYSATSSYATTGRV